jgi:hypothetical protein
VSETSERLDLEGRKALSWYRTHGPAGISVAGTPQRRARVALIRRGLLCIHPARKLGDPIRYAITARGIELLKGLA